ncbi:hypothetical protein, partial [Pasteurella sp. 22655_41Tandhals]|uniref:hypothetical protein n=1 Tax=Pasteurella sp. 22655_41Tandhals TaxID=3416655 RepID=UPI003CE79C0B
MRVILRKFCQMGVGRYGLDMGNTGVTVGYFYSFFVSLYFSDSLVLFSSLSFPDFSLFLLQFLFL